MTLFHVVLLRAIANDDPDTVSMAWVPWSTVIHEFAVDLPSAPFLGRAWVTQDYQVYWKANPLHLCLDKLKYTLEINKFMHLYEDVRLSLHLVNQHCCLQQEHKSMFEAL